MRIVSHVKTQHNGHVKAQLQPFFSPLYRPLYSFAHALIFDELQAKQVVIDACTRLMVELTCEQRDHLSAGLDLDLLQAQRRHLFHYVYTIAKKRWEQLPAFEAPAGEGLGFYQLAFIERAILFLRHQAGEWVERSDIGFILDLEKAEVTAWLQSARVKLATHRGESLPQHLFSLPLSGGNPFYE